MKSKREIEDLMGDAITRANERSKYPGMNYEQGVEAALRWVLDDDSENPLEDD